MSRQAIILAGGAGTRLRTVMGDIPKALAPVGGVPVLGHQLGICQREGFDDIVLLLGYGADAIRNYVGDGSTFGLRCRSFVETTPLGTAGAVLAARDWLSDRFIVMYCDTMLDISLGRMWEYHLRHGADATLLVHPNDHPFDSDLVATDEKNRITGFSRWQDDGPPLRNLASAALYAVNRAVLDAVPPREGILDFGRDVFPQLVKTGRPIMAYRSVEYIKDIGTPQRLEKANRDLAIGKVDPLNCGRSRPAIFLDRDGTLNVETGGVRKPEDLVLLPGVPKAIRAFNGAGIAPIVVTNQPLVSHGVLDEAGLDRIHAVLERELARDHAFVDAVYYCPHHPDSGYAGERIEFKIKCDCRKPQAGMIRQATQDLHLDLSQSWMIGDQTADIGAARQAGVRSILLRTGFGGRDGKHAVSPDYIMTDLEEAAEFITHDYPLMKAQAQALCADLRGGDVILIGGLARSGKSTWAAVLEDAARAAGHATLRLSLDAWLKSETERGPGVLDRYDLASAKAAIETAMTCTAPTQIEIPKYDLFTRQRVGASLLTCAAGAVIIVEGVPALALDIKNARRFAVSVSAEQRRARFERYYDWRGCAAAETDALWQTRDAEETPTITALNNGADLLVSGTKDSI